MMYLWGVWLGAHAHGIKYGTKTVGWCVCIAYIIYVSTRYPTYICSYICTRYKILRPQRYDTRYWETLCTRTITLERSRGSVWVIYGFTKCIKAHMRTCAHAHRIQLFTDSGSSSNSMIVLISLSYTNPRCMLSIILIQTQHASNVVGNTHICD